MCPYQQRSAYFQPESSRVKGFRCQISLRYERVQRVAGLKNALYTLTPDNGKKQACEDVSHGEILCSIAMLEDF